MFKMDESNNWFVNKGKPKFVGDDPIQEQKIHSSNKVRRLSHVVVLILVPEGPRLRLEIIFLGSNHGIWRER